MRRTGEQTRAAILRAAIARFGRDGYRSTSVADIARDASVSGTLAYAYFPNKEALFLAAVDEDAAAVVHEGLSRVLHDPDAGPEDWRETLIVTLAGAVERHPLARRLLGGLEPTPPIGCSRSPLWPSCGRRVWNDCEPTKRRASFAPTSIPSSSARGW